MLEFIDKVLEHRIEQIRKNEIRKEKGISRSEHANTFIISKKYIDILRSSHDVTFLYRKCKIPIRTKKMISEINVKMNNLYQNFLITSTEIEFDDILALAVAYYNLGDMYIYNEVNFEVAKDYLMKCIKLLKGKELHCKVILTAIRARVDLGLVYKKFEQLENCYLLLDEALELYLNYTKDEDEYPDPLEIDAVYVTKNEVINNKISLTKIYILTLQFMAKLFSLQPRNMHKFVIHIHNLLNKQLEIMENSTESNMFLCWAEASFNLSFYFLYHDRFMEAKIHLAAANYMMTMHYFQTYIDEDYYRSEKGNIEKYKLLSTFLYQFWALYYIMLLRSSKKRLMQCKSNKSCESNVTESESHLKSEEELMKPLTFVDLEKHLDKMINYHITDKYISNLKVVQIIFSRVLQWLERAKLVYNQIGLFIGSINIILYMSEAYRNYIYFEGSKRKQIKTIKQQVNLLENSISALSSKCNLLLEYHYFKMLHFELAITYSTLLNMTSELNENKEITDEMRMETNRLVGNIIHNFNSFINMS